MAEEMERVYVIPLKGNKNLPETKRAPHSMKVIRSFVAKHMKADESDVWIDPRLGEAVWARGRKHSPAKLRVKVIKFEDELIEVSLPDE